MDEKFKRTFDPDIIVAFNIGRNDISFVSSSKRNWDKVSAHLWKNRGGFYSEKESTCILLKKDFSESSIGYDAEETYSDLKSQDRHHDYYFFASMSLDRIAALHRSVVYMDVEGKTLEACIVLKHFIKCLKSLLQENWLLWAGLIFTIPAFWEDSGKEVVKEAALQAGINRKRLMIAFEQEAIFTYCHSLTFAESKEIYLPSLDHIKPHIKYVVVNLGDDMTEITVHHKCKDGSLKKIPMPRSKGPWGRKSVDDQVLKVLTELVGEKAWAEFKREELLEYRIFLRTINFMVERFMKNNDKVSRISIPIPLREILENAIEKNNEIKKKICIVQRRLLQFNTDFIIGFIKKTIYAIAKHIDEVLQESETKDAKVMFVVGSFELRKKVVAAILDCLCGKINITYPIHPENAIVAGAVYMGHFSDAFLIKPVMYVDDKPNKVRFKEPEYPEKIAEKVLKIGFIGAGAINFGRLHVQWNHASRLEQIGGIEVVGIVELDEKLATEVLRTRQSCEKYGSIYKKCKLFKNYKDLIKLRPDAVFIGIPPAYRGSFEEGKDLELQFARAGIHVFVEKPLSVLPPEEFILYAKAVTETCKEKNVIVSVGYMFRSHAGILKIKELIKQHEGKVMALNARYNFAEKFFFKKDLDFSGGPIVEQTTHFCDLARIVVSDVEMDTIHTILPQTPEKIKRKVKMSHWRFKDGGLGTLMHSIAHPGTRYGANIDVQLDGLQISFAETYEKDCIVRVCSIDMEDDYVNDEFYFPSFDTYMKELETFMDAIRTNDSSMIKNTYIDAALTYQMAWAIQTAT